MRRLIKRSPNMGYKGMAKLANQSSYASDVEEEDMPNPFIGDNFFKANPSKVLGVQHIERGRFKSSEIIVVDGDLSDVNRIDAIPVAIADYYPQQDYSTKDRQQLLDDVFEEEVKSARKQLVKKVRTGSSKELPVTAPDAQEVYTFKEISDMYNKNISREEMEAYYMTHPELNHKLLFDKYTFDRDELVRRGLISWENGQYVYVYTYQSGNVGQKLSFLKRDKEKIEGLLGAGQYERQLEQLESVRPKAKSLVGDDRIVLLPHSNFAKEFKIMDLRPGNPELNGETSLFDAFKRWLRSLPPEEFERSTYYEIIDYYLDNKSIPVPEDLSREEKERIRKNEINLRQRTKEEGDTLFARFLSGELLPEDQAKLSYLWNEKFNSVVEPNLSKIPVCFQISKTFKAGAPFLLSATQRQAAAFLVEKKSGLLAYGTGVGKTASSIAALSQSYYNGYADKFLFVVPTNTYDKWLGELQGYKSKETGVFMHGLLPQLPPVQGLFNLNPTIVRDRLKVYSDEDEATFEDLEQAIMAVKAIDKKDFTDAQRKHISSLYPVNWNGVHAEYVAYLATTKALKTKTEVEYTADFLKKEYNYLIYKLGRVRDFPSGTIFVTTEVGLQRLGVSDVNKDELVANLYKILSQGELTADSSQRKKDVAKLQLKIEQTVASGLKNAKIYIEDIGINWVCFDEAHYYKKLFTFVKGDIVGTSERYDSKESVVYETTKREKTKYEIKSGAVPSSRALSAYVVSHYVQSTNNNRNVLHLTATPFTNSPLEVFSMLTLTNYKALQDLGLDNMVNFFDTFMRINYDIKYTPQKTVVKDVVLTGYNNLPQLRQVIYSLMDKKEEGANLKRPTKVLYPSVEKGIETTLPMTREQEELMAEVKAYINGKAEFDAICGEALRDEVEALDFDGLDDDALIAEWERSTNKEYEGEREGLTDTRRDQLIKQIKTQRLEGVELGESDLSDEESLGVRILKALAMMRQITLSPYLYYKACSKSKGEKAPLPDYKDYINSSPKLKYVMGCISSCIDYHKAHNERIGGQVIYMNAGVEYFPLIKEYLVKELHLKEGQVGIVSGNMSKGAKEQVKQKFLSGDILVLIGSSTISVGVDLQNNATTLYNCYYDWNPTDAQQIEGRIWRQGNRFAFVRLVYPQCYNSADPVIFEYLNQKTLRINEIWNRSSEVQELDLRDFNPKELQKKLITDPEEKASWEILEESDKIESQIIFFENRREQLSNALYAFREVNKLKDKTIMWLNKMSAQKMELAKKEAIAAQKDRLYDLQEKYGDDPEKLAAEILKSKRASYDYKTDPDGKFVPKKYSAEDLREVYFDIPKYNAILSDFYWGKREERDQWGEIGVQYSSINDLFNRFRSYYKDMLAAEERVLKPMGLDFSTAENPMAEFDAKLADLREQLKAIEASKDERIQRIRIELDEHRSELTTVEGRIKEFALDNAKYLTPQLLSSPVTTPAQLPKQTPEELLEPMVEEGFAKRKHTTIPPNKAVKASPELMDVPETIDSPPLPAAAPEPDIVEETSKVEEEPDLIPFEISEGDSERDIIENEIEALTLALEFAEAKEQKKIKEQIEALKVSLEFI